MSLGRAGHGASVAVELGSAPGYVPVSGVFTEIPELRGNIPGLSGNRATENITPHNDDIDSHTSGPIVRPAWQFTINYVPGNPVHEGLRSAWLDPDPTNRRRGWRFRGAGGSDGVDEVIVSGELVGWEDSSPEGAAPRQATLTIQPSKAFIIDGVEHGNAA